MGEGIRLINLARIVILQELAGIVAGEAKGHLGQVVRAEAEELSLLSDLACQQGCTGNLDHGADLVLDVRVLLCFDLFRCLNDHVLDKSELFLLAYERDHDLGNDAVALLGVDLDRSLHDSSGLHAGDLREGDRQTAAAVAHHRIELMQSVAARLDLCCGQAHILGQFRDLVIRSGDELVKRRIQETDGDRTAFHSLIDTLEVALLEGDQLIEGCLALLSGIREDHLADLRDPVRIEEHVLGPGQADAFRAHADRVGRILGGVGIGADFQSAELIRPGHDALEIAADGSFDCRDITKVDLAGGAVEGHVFTFFDGEAAELDVLFFLMDLHVAAAGDAAGAHSAGDDCSVAGHAAAHGQNAFRCMHAFDILGRGLLTDQDDTAAGSMSCYGVISREIDAACRCAGRCRKGFADLLAFFQGFRVKDGMEQLVERLRLDPAYCFLGSDHAFVHQVAGDLDRCLSSALAVPGLQEEQLAVLDRELHVLHVAVVLFKGICDIDELLVALRQILGELGDLLRCADTRNDILALCVDQILTEDALAACCGVTGEGDACAGRVSHVAEDHGLNVDSGTPGIRDIIHHTVVVCAGVVPGAENGLDGFHQLDLGILREFLTHLFLINSFVLSDDILQILCGQLSIIGISMFLFHVLEDAVKESLAHFHDNVGEHLDETAVRVICKAGIAGLLGEALDRDIVETQIQDRVHHTGHGCAGAGTDGDQKGILSVAELLALHAFKPCKRFEDLLLSVFVDGPAIVVVVRAGLSGDREAVRDGQTDIGHFRKVCSLAAQEIAHIRISLTEFVNSLAHSLPPHVICVLQCSTWLQ